MLDLSFILRSLHNPVPSTLLMEFSTNQGWCLQTAQLAPNSGCLYLLFLFAEIPSSEKMYIIWPPYFVQVCSNIISSKVFPNTPKQRNTPQPQYFLSPFFFFVFQSIYQHIVHNYLNFDVIYCPSLLISLPPTSTEIYMFFIIVFPISASIYLLNEGI